MQVTRVISVDPAPGKQSTVFDGDQFSSKPAHTLRDYLKDIALSSSATLLCWDAPLTGPTNVHEPGHKDGDFTKRPIEKFFSRLETTFKTPKGISVLDYSSCPHWTISRSLLGYPRVGPFDAEESCLPFKLISDPQDFEFSQPSVVEIHPALAAWLWCRDECEPTVGWKYKGQKRAEGNRLSPIWLDFWEIILRKSEIGENLPEPTTDDEFDAGVGYILGRTYSNDRMLAERRCEILGDKQNGAFLVPHLSTLFDAWEYWKERL